MSVPHRQVRTFAYVVRDEYLDAKQSAIAAVAERALGNAHIHWIIEDGPLDLGLFKRANHALLFRILDRGDQFIAWMPDLGGRMYDLRYTNEILTRFGVTQLLLTEQECLAMYVRPERPSLGLDDVLSPEAMAKLKDAWRRVNACFRDEQVRRSVRRRREENRRVSMRPPLGTKFMARAGKTYLVKDRAWDLWVSRILEWRMEGATIDECQRRLSRAGAKNPATGGVWSRWRVMRALKWARSKRGEGGGK